jgi:hypothetical protein
MSPPQPRLRAAAAAAENCVELFPWDDLLLLQQHLWVGCCSAEVSHVLTQQLAAEHWTPFSDVLPVAGSAVELYRMLQAALGVWGEVLLHVAPSAAAAAAAVGQFDLQHHEGAMALQQQQQQHDEMEQQRQQHQQEQHRFQKRRQHGQAGEIGVPQNHQQQQQQVQVSARSAALCKLMFGAVMQLQQQYLQHLLKSWDACCARSSSSSTAAAAAGSGGLVLTQQLSVLLNSLLLMRQEAERLEGALQQVRLETVVCHYSCNASDGPACRTSCCQSEEGIACCMRCIRLPSTNSSTLDACSCILVYFHDDEAGG